MTPTTSAPLMRAVTQYAVGGPGVLVTAEVERPVAGAGEVVVRVRAAGMNQADARIRSGEITRFGAPPFTLGLDFAGEVAEVGAGIAELVVGQRVFGVAFPPHGSHAQYVKVAATQVAPVPDALDDVRAAALPVAGLTALQAVDASGVTAGSRLLVHAAAGGVGHLAVQFAKARGAYVAATARAAKHPFLRGIGADEVVDYTAADFTTALGAPVDAVIDPIAGEYGPRSLDVLRPGGVLVDVRGGGPDRTAVQRKAERLGAELVMLGFTPSREDLVRIAAMVAAGVAQVQVAEVLEGLDAAPKAHELLDTGRVAGKVVLTVE